MEVDLTPDHFPGEGSGMTTMTAGKPRLLGAAGTRLLAVDVAAMTSFYLLLSAVPLYAADRGIGTAGAGLSTGVLMVTAVAAELATPALAARVGFGRLLAAGLVLLGAPALALPAVGGLAGLLAVAAVRGCGFAIVVVAVGTLAARAIPEQRRGEGLGVFGVAATVPAVVALPLGVWIAGVAGFPTVFMLAAGFAVLSVPLVPRPAACGTETEAPAATGRVGLPADVVRPAVVFFATAVAGGVVVAFLPGAVAPDVAAPALLVQSVAATVSRWLAGRYADRRGGARLLAPAVVVATAGMATAAATGSGPAVLTGMALFGAGFGVAQAASLTTMLQRVAPDRYGAVSAAWNAAYDLGWGVGALGIGLVVTSLGVPAGFATAAVLALTALPLTRDARTARDRHVRAWTDRA
jgi:predicted MFS family arabinose efflux permease